MVQTIFACLLEELIVPLLSAKERNGQDSCSVESEQSSYALSDTAFVNAVY